MFLPESFREPDRELVLDLIEEYPFATLITWTNAGGPLREPMVSHLPLLVERRPEGPVILGHFARANPHAKLCDGATPALAIFWGPHAYISPSWYETTPAVPTWNYVVAHIHGRPAPVDGDATRDIVARQVENHERSRDARWSAALLPPEFLGNQLQAIVGFRMSIDRIEAKFKLGQNRTDADRAGTFDGLEREPDAASRELAAFARRYYARKEGKR
jgi:transcriptional regulator